MKRSEINNLLREGVDFLNEMKFQLPPFAYWSKQDWADKGAEYDELRQNMLGWDVTDFGSGDFARIGLLVFTLRNGNLADGNLTDTRYAKPYAEKLLIANEEQVTPYHFHHKKMEDIINRGGGNLLIKLYNSDENEQFADTDVCVSSDGRNYTVPAGTVVRLTPGESITLPTGLYHSFWGEPGKGKVLIGEVSKVNDDRVDNRFFEAIGRFPTIDEDAEPLYVLAMDYPGFAE